MQITMTVGEYQTSRDEYQGICTSCGAIHDCLEQDAREVKCEECGKRTVYGTEEALFMGCIKIDAVESV